MRVKQPWKEYDHKALEDKLNIFWERTQAYKRAKAARKRGDKFYLADGPPFTTGTVDLGHIYNKVVKDVIIRYKRLQGLEVRDQPGFDMHGLPIEVKVEGSLGIKGKREIEELGLEKFIASCKDFSFEYQQKMVEQFQNLGIWMDWEMPYLTVDNNYIESAWWSLQKIHSRELLVKASNVLAWCPRCETALADSEIEKEETAVLQVYMKFPIKGRRDEYAVVCTSQFWTIIGNMAIAVHPDYNYARVTIRQKGRKETLIVLEEKVEELAQHAGIEAYEIVETVKGKELEGLEYFHPLMADVPFQKEAEGEWVHKIVTDKSVRAQYTGCVHIAPAHGTEDFNIGSKYKLPVFSPLDDRGIITTMAGMKYAGKTVNEAEEKLLSDLKSMRFVLSDSEEVHWFGHCWRCDTPIVYRATEQWCIRVGDVRDKLLKASRGIKWAPDWLGKERFQDWVKNSRDWCISRQRYWGIPLPIWECITDVCAHVKVVGSVKELEGSSGFSPEMDLHRPWIDNISLECPKCGGVMKRVPDTLDVWFDSSVSSWAQLNYPKKKKAFKSWWPSDIITEGQEQVKGWFFGQLVSGVMVHGKVPYKSVLAHGMLCDGEGSPVSKSFSEQFEPSEVLGLYGIDAFRLYVLGGAAPWENLDFNFDDLKRANGTLRILWNSLAFATSYMHIDSYDPFGKSYNKVKKDLTPEDNWLLSKVETLTNDVKKEMEALRLDVACALLENFIVNDLSRTYIRIIRRRMWKEGGSPDKEAAYKTLHETLTRLAVLASPIVPYISEEIYQALDRRALSVHMQLWPEVQAARIAEGSEKSMTVVKQVVDVAMKLRQKHSLKLRWPVQKIIISSADENVTDAISMFDGVVKGLVNVKEIEVVPPGQEWEGQELEVIPNPNVIGKAYKQWESKVARMLRVLPAKDVREKIEKGEYQLGIEGQTIKILPEMVNFKTKLQDGIVTEDFGEGQLFMDISESDELRSEGYAREVIRRVQDMRKDMELDIEEYIKLSVVISHSLADLLDNYGNLEVIVDETRSNQVEIVDDAEGDYIIEWEVEGEPLVIGITALDIKRSVDEFARIPSIDRKLALSLVDAGISGGAMFTDSQREFILKFPGMTNAKFRKIKEYFETPVDMRVSDQDQICPICEGDLEPGAEICPRCGMSEDGDMVDIPEIEFVGELSEEEELAESLIEDEMLDDEEENWEAEEPEPVAPKPKKAKKTPEPEPEIGPEDELPPEDEPPVEGPEEVEAEDAVRAEPEAEFEEVAEDISEPEYEEVEAEPDIDAVGDEEVVPEEEVPPDEETPAEDEPHPDDELASEDEDEAPSEEGEVIVIEEEDETVEISVEDAIIQEAMGEMPEKPPRKPVVAVVPEIGPEEDEEDEDDDKPTSFESEIEVGPPDESVDERIEEQPDDSAEEPIEEPAGELTISTTEPSSEPAVATLEPAEEEVDEEEPDVPEGSEKPDRKPPAKDDIIGRDRDDTINTLSGRLNISPSMAKLLYSDGYRSPESFEGVSEDELRAIKGIGKVTARNIINAISTEETQMCTLCNAIVPADAKACPRCGVKFTHEEDGEEKVAERQESTIALLDKKLKKRPDDTKLLYSKAMTLKDAGRDVEALETIETAIKISPDDEKLLAARASITGEEEKQSGGVDTSVDGYVEAELAGPSGEDESVEVVLESNGEAADGHVSEDVPDPGEDEEPEDPIELKESFTYLIPEERSDRSYSLLKKMTNKSMSSFCITRTFPDKVRERYQLGDTPILWLSNVSKDDAVRPKDLEKLSLALEEFLSKQGGIVLLDGIEYLITNNNFITVLKLIQSLRDQVAINRSILLLSINPSTMEVHQINLLRREVDMVIEE